MFRFLLLLIATATLVSCSQNLNKQLSASEIESLASRYDVVIERDYLGVPHIIGKSDNDTAFGFGYAQAEDGWQTIEDSIVFYRGKGAKIKGLIYIDVICQHFIR